MMVMCIRGEARRLTKGEYYKLLYEQCEYYTIIDNRNNGPQTWFKSRFKSAEDSREEKLNRLLR